MLVQRGSVKFYIPAGTITHVLWLTFNRKLIILKRTLTSHNDEHFFSDVLNHSILNKEQKNTCIANYNLGACIQCTRSQEPGILAYVV